MVAAVPREGEMHYESHKFVIQVKSYNLFFFTIFLLSNSLDKRKEKERALDIWIGCS